MVIWRGRWGRVCGHMRAEGCGHMEGEVACPVCVNRQPGTFSHVI